MTTTTLRSTCDDHPNYVAGCPHCQTAARTRFRAIHRAKAYGTHQPVLVSPVGAARRLQGLACAGYEATALADRMNIRCTVLLRWRGPTVEHITRRRHNDIAHLTEQLSATTGPSRLARTLAHQRGWVPLAAWDDIDDPDEMPRVRAARHRRDGQPLIERVLAGRADIDILTVDEQAHLWLLWAAERQEHGEGASAWRFGRHFDITRYRAARIIAAAQHIPTRAASGRIDRKAA